MTKVWKDPNYYGEGKGALIIKQNCKCKRPIPLQVDVMDTDRGPAVFSWNKDTESPTINPSVGLHLADSWDCQCHFFVRDGVAEHCSDSEYPNQSIPLIDLETKS